MRANSRLITLLPLIFLFVVRAAETPADVPEAKPLPNLGGLLGLSNLVINPKVITPTDGGDTTVGVDYKYDRRVVTVFQGGRTDVDFSVHSEGLIVVEEEKSPNRLLTHGVRLSLVDLWPSKRHETPADDEQRSKFRTINDTYLQTWEELAQDLKGATTSTERDALRLEMDNVLGQAQAELAPYGRLEGDPDKMKLYLSGQGKTPRVEVREKLMQDMKLITPRFVFLSFDLNGDAETDQTFEDVQLVGMAQLRGKFLVDWFDVPFALLRGGGKPVNYLNRNGGPHFWGGAAIVDASNVESRKELVGDGDNHFARAHVGVSYRTEVYSGSSPLRCVSLELSWRYYYEFDAPRALRRRNLDNTSYFKATLLFPGNYFLEYTDGKLPLDVEGASTVSVGWRHNF